MISLIERDLDDHVLLAHVNTEREGQGMIRFERRLGRRRA